MIKLNTYRATRTVIGLAALLGLGACTTPVTQPWLGRTYQSPAPQTYQHQVPQAQPYVRQQPHHQTQRYTQRPAQTYPQQRLPEAQPPQYVPLPPSVRPYDNRYGNRASQNSASVPTSRPAPPVATTRPLWEEENVRVQNLPATRPNPRPASRPVPQTSPSSSAASSASNGNANARTNTPAPTSTAGTADDPGNRYMDMAAVQVLTTQANSAVQAEEWGRAGDALERALRIQPDNPRLWLRLGEVYKEQGNKQQAAEMARKAMRIAPGDAYIARRAGLLLK